MKKTLCLLAAIQLAACGNSGGGSSSSGGDDSPSTQNPDPTTPAVEQPTNVITGVLVDPYIADAKVCLDVNENNACDDGEAVVETDENGAFKFTLASALDASAQVILLNRGSFQAPNYGYHEGIAYELPLSASIPVGENQLVVTPASTANVMLNVDAATLAAILNQFSSTIGKTLDAADLEGNPFANLPQGEVDADALAALRANLALYSLLRTLTALDSVSGYEGIVATFAADAQDSSSATYELIRGIVQTIAAGIDQNLMTSIQGVIDAGNTQLQTSVPSTITVPDLPDLSTEVVMSTAAAIADAFINEAILAVVEGLGNIDASKTFEQNYSTITTSVVAKMQALKAQTNFNDLVLSLGTKTYAAVNRGYFTDNYKDHPFAGDAIINGIFAVNTDLQEGYNCEDGHFALGFTYTKDGAGALTGIESVAVCTSAVPAEISEQLGDYSGEDDSPVDDNIWANLPVGSLRVSDQTTGCTFNGTVKDENNDVLEFVPMYFAYPPLELEMYVQTDSNGQFEFTHIPLNEGEYADDQYFFGTYAGVRGPHPEFQDKEAVSDFNVRCETDGDVYSFQPVMKDIVANTTLTGTIDTELIGEGFRIELAADLSGNNTVFTKNGSTVGIDRAWIMESIEDESEYNHPHMNFNSTTGEFTVRELAGGDYKLRVVAGETGEGDALRASFEFDLDDADTITVAPGGGAVTINLEFNEANETYTLTGGGASGTATSYSGNIN